MQNPLISITIPTRNSEKTLEHCLSAIRSQTYQNIELIIIDSNSTDRTVEIAKSYSSRIITTSWKLLGARYLGVEASKGDYILLLDSDQILSTDTLHRLVDAMEEYDMFCLEETSFEPRSFLERLFDADRRFVQEHSQLHLDPSEGVMLARFYRASILKKAFQNIAIDKLHDVVAHDHAIIYYEAYRLSSRVGVLSKAVMHEEPTSLAELWRKNYRYGKTTRELLNKGLYGDLLRRKTRFRKGASLDLRWFQSTLLLFLKGIPYFIGLYS